jgi:DNA-binding beta-propeller fold protein YncE
MLRASGALPFVALVAACATPAPRPSPAADVTWPAPPASPRVRLVAILPAPAEPSRMRRVLDAIAGIERSPEDGQILQRPFGVAVGGGRSVLVADPDAGVLRVEGSRAEPVACRGREWGAPMAVAAGEDGSILVADAGTAEIVRVAPDGACTVLGAGELERPTGIAAGAQRVFVTDPPRHEVLVFSSTGIARIGGQGDGAGQFDFPTAAALAPDGTVLVVDALNFRVVRLGPDGAWLAAFGEAGDEGGAFERPKGIAVDSGGRVYVSDAQRDLVLVFQKDGTFEYAIGGTGTSPGWFTHPAGLAIAGGRLYVADSHNHRIQVFEILGERS